jgi:ribosomal protein S18 acetylase RimI-like enzyme
MNAVIRNYQPEDFDQIVRNLQISENNMYAEDWDSRANYDDLSRRDVSNVLVAEASGDVVGSVILLPLGPDAVLLFRLAVCKDFRSHGIATQLLEKARAVCKKRGAKSITLWVDADNEQLLDFYRKRGYSHGSKKTYACLWTDIEKEESQ